MDNNYELPKELPELLDDTLDTTTCWQLFSDIATFGADVQIMTKGRTRRHGQAVPITLAEAHELLADDEVVAVQVRYLYQGAHWCDTVMRRNGEYRIVRVKLVT